ncbi:hypothetical protein J6590_020317 [Homalodisca vitripennis]|nr:hypothetical protein J6590_020317 [Homalodisca vitripennis]
MRPAGSAQPLVLCGRHNRSPVPGTSCRLKYAVSRPADPQRPQRSTVNVERLVPNKPYQWMITE